MKKVLNPSPSGHENPKIPQPQNLLQEERKRPQVTEARHLKKINPYVEALLNDFSQYAFDEVPSRHWRGRWRSSIFLLDDDAKLHVEIGTGNGLHLARRCSEQIQQRRLMSEGDSKSQNFSDYNDVAFVGLEIKFKPLIQTIRRCVETGFQKVRGIRAHAFNLDLIFAEQEIDNLFIHFPDPWVSPRKPEKRLTTKQQLNLYFELQRPGSLLEFKTDSQELFDFTLQEVSATRYRVQKVSRDLHQEERIPKDHLTQFERLFMRKGLPIYYAIIERP